MDNASNRICHSLTREHLVRNRYAAPYVSVASVSAIDYLLAIVIDDPQGNYASETVWDDTNVAKLDTIADTQLHRNVDTLILAADKEGESRACVQMLYRHSRSTTFVLTHNHKDT